jgi:pimeloyl-ACP methyl ester carboxylesterase
MLGQMIPFRIDVPDADLADLRERQGDRAADRPGRARRRPSGCVPRRMPIAARLRVQRKAIRSGLGDRADRCGLGHPDGPARLLAVRSQGGDWGTSISTLLARHDPQHVAGIHLTPPLAPPDPATFGDLTEAERSTLASLEHSAEWDSGYSKEHSTRPQTIGYALTDSPAALCAWIIEKFWAWTDHDGHLEQVLARDELLDNLMLYWLPRTGASAARLYWESIRQVNEWITGTSTDTVCVPVGCSVFPRELQRPSRR